MLSPDAPVRHGWVRLVEGWEGHLRSPLTGADRAAVEGWRREGRPLVVARRQPLDGEDELRLGLALPDKRRIGVHAVAVAVLEQTGPLALADALASAPEAWRARLDAVAWRTEALGVTAGVFGSLAWQHRTGLSYVRRASDVDLLFAPRRWPEVEALLAVLGGMNGAEPRLDGEILLPDGGAVAWRELAARPAKLLVKGTADVALQDLQSVVARFPDARRAQEG